jgi:AbrB family looped-hinge helix DNA binding protein
MTLARSKVTSQGRLSVPAEVRRRLGLGPGAVLEWDEEDGKIIVRRAARYTSQDIHRVLFPGGPPRGMTIEALKAGLKRHIRKREARH